MKLRKFMSVIGLVLVLALFAVFLITAYPSLVVNPTTVRFVANSLFSSGIHLTWKTSSIRFESYGFLDKRVVAGFDDLCLRKEPMLESACFRQVEFSARYRLTQMTKLVSVGPVTIDGGQIDLRLGSTKSGTSSPPSLAAFSWLRKIDVYPVSIKLDHFEIHQNETIYSGNLQFLTTSDENHRLSAINVAGQVRKVSPDEAVQPESATVSIQLKVGEMGQMEHHVDLHYENDKLTADGELYGNFSNTFFKSDFKGSLSRLPSLLQRVDIPSGTLELISTEKDKNRGVLTLSCPVDIVLKRMKLSPKLGEIYRTPEKVHLDISSRINTFFIPDLDQKIDGTAQVNLQTSQNRLVQTTGGANFSFSGIPSATPSSWHLESDLAIHFIIDRMSRLVQALEKIGLPVPTPLNVLDGSVALGIKGHLSSLSQRSRFPITFSTDLHSANQQVSIEGEGEAQIPISKELAGTEIGFDLQLNDVQLELPGLEAAGIPRVTTDRRFGLKTRPENNRESLSSFAYQLHITTPDDHPARILSNITPDFIPIHLDLLLNQSTLAGDLSISEFPLELFNQKATVEKLTFSFREPMKDTQVNGKFHLYFPELQIIISLEGTVDHPYIDFTSIPPMSRGDMLSMVIYGEPLRDVDIDQASSVGNMNAALDDHVLSLATFLLLSSTPIQNVAYNPQTRAFTARVRLGKKTALSVGAGKEEEHALLIRRIGKGWRISAGVEKTEDDSQAAGSVMIEWQKRY